MGSTSELEVCEKNAPQKDSAGSTGVLYPHMTSASPHMVVCSVCD